MAETGSAFGTTVSTREGTPELHIEFCGEHLILQGDRPLGIGAAAELNLDVGASLPDRLLELRLVERWWCIEQLAPGATASISAAGGRWRARLTVGDRVPLVFDRQVVHITGVRGAYEIELTVTPPLFEAIEVDGAAPACQHGEAMGARDGHTMPTGMERDAGDGVTIVEDAATLPVVLTDEQRVLLTVLAAPVLRQGDDALSEIPSSVEAARALGWPVTKFNRKLDTVCARLSGAGVTGLHGGSGRPALNRRTRLVQVAVAARLVGRDDLLALGG